MQLRVYGEDANLGQNFLQRPEASKYYHSEDASDGGEFIKGCLLLIIPKYVSTFVYLRINTDIL